MGWLGMAPGSPGLSAAPHLQSRARKVNGAAWTLIRRMNGIIVSDGSAAANAQLIWHPWAGRMDTIGRLRRGARAPPQAGRPRRAPGRKRAPDETGQWPVCELHCADGQRAGREIGRLS